ncbi:MAG: hypothetical protein HQL79_11270 [Magnetococcales bacterium]|nr:hypothetical protein [Magnetococcales bacterium]
MSITPITAPSLQELAINAKECCANGPISNLILQGDYSISEIDSDFVKSFSEIAGKWQCRTLPSDLYFNHGQYIDRGGEPGRAFLVKELKRKPDSNRACFSLISMNDIVQSEDKPIPSFLVLQFSIVSHTIIEVTAYFRVIEVSEFLPINLAEISDILRHLAEKFPKIESFSLTIFAFRAYLKIGFSCLTKSILDMTSPVDIAIAVENKDVKKIIQMLEGKLNTVDSIICIKGLETLLEAIEKSTKKYGDDLKKHLRLAISSSRELIEMRKSSSYSERILEKQSRINKSLEQAIALLQSLEKST